MCAARPKHQVKFMVLSVSPCSLEEHLPCGLCPAGLFCSVPCSLAPLDLCWQCQLQLLLRHYITVQCRSGMMATIGIWMMNSLTSGGLMFLFVVHLNRDHCLCFSQILLVSDYFYAFLRREHHLSYGLYLKKKDGSEATLVLK